MEWHILLGRLVLKIIGERSVKRKGRQGTERLKIVQILILGRKHLEDIYITRVFKGREWGSLKFFCFILFCYVMLCFCFLACGWFLLGETHKLLGKIRKIGKISIFSSWPFHRSGEAKIQRNKLVYV